MVEQNASPVTQFNYQVTEWTLYVFHWCCYSLTLVVQKLKGKAVSSALCLARKSSSVSTVTATTQLEAVAMMYERKTSIDLHQCIPKEKLNQIKKAALNKVLCHKHYWWQSKSDFMQWICPKLNGYKKTESIPFFFSCVHCTSLFLH